MSVLSPPLRFLTAVVGGWVCLRALLVAPGWWIEPASAGRPPSQSAARTPLPAPAVDVREGNARPALVQVQVRSPEGGSRVTLPAAAQRTAIPLPIVGAPLREEAASVPSAAAAQEGASSPILAEPFRLAGPGRWAFSGWAFVRGQGGRALAPGGTLGGSQAGGRLTYRLNDDPVRPLGLSLRVSGPARMSSGAEAALGLDWKPSRRLPIHLLAERRQAIGRGGRSAFALTAYGGISEAPLGPLRVDGYVQAGVVGTRSRDLFADGGLRLALPLNEAGDLKIGAGAWGGVQPGLSRVDLGPHAVFTLPAAGRAVSIAVDWRFRVAGNARPGSGPSLTLATDF